MINNLKLALLLGFMLFGVSIAYAGIETYSTTASSNTALFPEGMDPSAVNNGMREVQADTRTWYETPEWRDLNDTPTFVDTNTFTFASDLTTTYVVNIRLKITGSGAMGTVYGEIDVSSFGGGVNTIDVTLDSGSLDNTINKIEVSITPTNAPIPLEAVDNISSVGFSSTSITGQSSADIAIADQITFADNSNSDALKKDNITGILELAYPIGAIYISTVSTNPNTLFGFGTWTAFGAGKVLVSLDSGDSDFDTSEETGGSKTHTLTSAEMPSHTHTGGFFVEGSTDNVGSGDDRGTATSTGSAGSGNAHNNVQPYIVVYMFERAS